MNRPGAAGANGVGRTTGAPAALEATGAALELDAVSIRLGGRAIVSDVSAEVEPGGWLTIVGANGAGKSTLLRAVCGLVAHAGVIRLAGTASTKLSNRERAKRVALVAQSPVMPSAMSVASYVLLGRTAHLGPLARESAADLTAVAAVLARLDASDLAGRPLGTLSGGEAQRVAIARALVQDAPVLLLDEPTSSLDIGHQLEVLDLVDELRRERGLTVLSTMHDLTLAAQYADRLLLMYEGRVVVSGRPAEVLTEEHLSRYYRARVQVIEQNGTFVVVPVRRGPARP